MPARQATEPDPLARAGAFRYRLRRTGDCRVPVAALLVAGPVAPPASVSRVGERRPVAADAAVVKVERTVVDTQLVADELLPVAIVSGDDTGDGLRSLVTVADADIH